MFVGRVLCREDSVCIQCRGRYIHVRYTCGYVCRVVCTSLFPRSFGKGLRSSGGPDTNTKGGTVLPEEDQGRFLDLRRRGETKRRGPKWDPSHRETSLQPRDKTHPIGDGTRDQTEDRKCLKYTLTRNRVL